MPADPIRRVEASRQGFTLIELLLSMAVVGILTAISIPVLSRVQTKNDLDTATQSLVSSLRRASILTQSVDGDTSWGVKVQSGSITLFKGASFAARDTTYDEVYSVPTTLSASGISEIVMSKFTGYPTNSGSAVLTNTALPSESATVTVNGRGMVSY